MSRQPYQWKQEQLKLAESRGDDNVAKHAIAEELGVSYSTLQFHLEVGELKHLPKRRKGTGPKKSGLDCEKQGILFGVSDWKERAEAVRRGWQPEERYKRRHGHV